MRRRLLGHVQQLDVAVGLHSAVHVNLSPRTRHHRHCRHLCSYWCRRVWYICHICRTTAVHHTATAAVVRRRLPSGLVRGSGHADAVGVSVVHIRPHNRYTSSSSVLGGFGGRVYHDAQLGTRRGRRRRARTCQIWAPGAVKTCPVQWRARHPHTFLW